MAKKVHIRFTEPIRIVQGEAEMKKVADNLKLLKTMDLEKEK